MSLYGEMEKNNFIYFTCSCSRTPSLPSGYTQLRDGSLFMGMTGSGKK